MVVKYNLPPLSKYNKTLDWLKRQQVIVLNVEEKKKDNEKSIDLGFDWDDD